MFADDYELNYTKLKSYLDCPLSYKYKFIDFKRPSLNEYSSLGLSIHKALQIYYENKENTWESLLDAYIDNWQHIGFEAPRKQVEFYEKGINMLKKYWKQDRTRKSEVVYVEKNFEFAYDKWTVKGIIDRVDKNPDGSWELIEYKTGPEHRTQKEIMYDLQLGIYALGLKKNLDINVDYLSVYLLAFGKKITVKYDKSSQSHILKKICDLGDEIIKGDFKPRTQYCPRCSFNEVCPFAK